LLLLGTAFATAADAEYLPGTPFTYLFDTGSRSPRPLAPKTLDAKEGWTLVAEDDTEHAFQGDAVLLNDKLILVLRRQGPGAEVYSQTPDGPKLRAVVMAAPPKAIAITGASSVRIVENNPGAVMVEADFHVDGQTGTCTASFRLTTGQAMLEMTGGKGAERFFVWSNTRYLVVPDFFADDMVFSAATCDVRPIGNPSRRPSRFGLPTESFLLGMIEGGDCVLACVWRSPEQEAYAVARGSGADLAIRGCEIEGGAEKTLWVALLEQPDVWRVASVADFPLKRPFPARWRADWFRPDGASESWESEGEEVFGAGPQRGPARRLRDTEKLPCLVYALDRSPKTPLTVLCPIDVLRGALGVGPCEYVLESEGLATDTNPTPDEVMSWVVDMFSGNRDVPSADRVRERLDAMVDHVGRTQARIDEYASLARELRAMFPEQEDREGAGDAVELLGGIVDDVEQAIATGRRNTDPAGRVAELAEQIVGLVGTEDALMQCGGPVSEVRRIGGTQDRTLARCRMAVRWLKQQARMTAIRDPRAAGLAREIRAQIEQFVEGR
jgi:hypothetical protein